MGGKGVVGYKQSINGNVNTLDVRNNFFNTAGGKIGFQ